jgi:hypothetical protein
MGPAGLSRRYNVAWTFMTLWENPPLIPPFTKGGMKKPPFTKGPARSAGGFQTMTIAEKDFSNSIIYVRASCVNVYARIPAAFAFSCRLAVALGRSFMRLNQAVRFFSFGSIF